MTAAFLAGLLAAHRPRPDADSAYALADEELEECKRKLRRMKQKHDEELAAVEVAAGERAQRQGLELAAMAVRVCVPPHSPDCCQMWLFFFGSGKRRTKCHGVLAAHGVQ